MHVANDLDARRSTDHGFTLIELLVVMIIIGILTSIAIPVFLEQQRKARDTAVKQDVMTISKDVLSALSVDGGDLSGQQGTQQLQAGPSTIPLELSPDTEMVTATGNQTSWCIAARNKTDETKGRMFRFTAEFGLQAVPRAERNDPCNV